MVPTKKKNKKKWKKKLSVNPLLLVVRVEDRAEIFIVGPVTHRMFVKRNLGGGEKVDGIARRNDVWDKFA